MGVDRDKYYDAKQTANYCDLLKKTTAEYLEYAKGVHDSHDAFYDNILFNGMTATAMKTFIKFGTGKLLTEMTDLHQQMVDDQDYLITQFESMVDSSQNARIETFTLEKIDLDFMTFYHSYIANANDVRSIVDGLISEFGSYKSFTQPNSKDGKDALEFICGGEAVDGGFFKDCLKKFLAYDSSVLSYLKGRDTLTKKESIDKRLLATAAALGGITGAKVAGGIIPLNVITAIMVAAAAAAKGNQEKEEEKEDSRGKRYGIDEDSFLKVTYTDENGVEHVSYGGSQAWFTEEENKKHNLDPSVDIDGYGCGVIAAVNEALYLSGVTEISREDYMNMVYSYFNSWARKHELSKGWPVLGVGATPKQLQDFIRSECKKNGVTVKPSWDYTEMDMEERYQYMKDSVQDNKPVIWGIHDNDGDILQFYTYDEKTGQMKESWQKVSSHYVTATAVFESYDSNGNEVRYVEISSYGEPVYVKWDEFINFVDVKIDMSQSDAEKVQEFIEDGVANMVGSSVMVIE